MAHLLLEGLRSSLDRPARVSFAVIHDPERRYGGTQGTADYLREVGWSVPAPLERFLSSQGILKAAALAFEPCLAHWSFPSFLKA